MRKMAGTHGTSSTVATSDRHSNVIGVYPTPGHSAMDFTPIINDSSLRSRLFGYSANDSVDGFIISGSDVFPDAKLGNNTRHAAPDGNMSASEQNYMSHIYGIRFPPYTALALCGFIFNTLSLAAMSKIRGNRKSVHHTLLRNLAVCDMFGSVLLWMYYNSPYIFPRFDITRLEHCMFITVVLVAPFIFSLCCSSLSLLMLALNQYIAICSPLFSATRATRGKAVIFIAAAWLLSLLLCLVPCFLMLFMTRFEHCAMSAVAMGQTSLEICAYALTGLIIIIVALYARIYREIVEYRHRTPQLNRRTGGGSHQHHHNSTGAGAANSSNSTSRNGGDSTEGNYKAFITTLLLSGTLVLFWLPYMIFHFISAHMDIENEPDFIWHIKFYVIDFMPMLNFLTDPIIYGIRMREIREGYRRIFAVLFPCCAPEPRQIARSSVRFTTLTTSI